MPKGQDQGGVLDRLRRRIDNYRKRHEEVEPRYANSISNQNQQQKQDTLLLRQRFLETNKAKKSAKKSEKKQHSDSSGSSVGPSKSNKRQNEDDHNGAEGFEPPSKIGGAGRGTSSPLPSNSTNSSLYKQSFSQNGKRGGNKTKALDSQKYPASSSNHPKNGIGRVPPPPPPIQSNSSSFSQCNNTTAPVVEFKKENNATSLPDFADLDQCAAALEKDAAKNGAITGGFIGESSTDEIFNSDVFNDLISEISDLNPEVMGNFYDLDDGPPPTADDLNDVTLHGSGTSANGSCNSNEPFHPVTPVTPTTASPMRSTNVGHGHLPGIKMEGGAGVDGTSLGVHGMDRGLSHCAGPSPAPASTASPLASQLGSSHQPSPSQSYNNSHFVMDNGQTGSPLSATGVVNTCNNGGSMAKPSTRLPYSSPAGLTVDSPAAQTLKHMAEQHQHKAQMCMNSSSTTNGGVSFKNQGSVGSPAGSPYGAIGNYNGNMNPDFSGTTNNMSAASSNCQIKQEVCSPGNSQAGFSPSPMMVDMQAGNKRPGQHNGSSPSGQSTRMPNMNSAGGSPIMSPISKSFNHPSPLNTSSSQGPIPPTQNPQQSQQAPYMPMNRLPGPSQPYPSTNPRFASANSSQISVASPKSVGSNQGHVNDRGSPATQMDSKAQLRLGVPNPNMQQQPPQQQQPQFPQQQFHYGNGPNNSMPMEMGFNSGGHPQNSQMQPQPQQQQQTSGQTINFTQQHLRIGNQGGIPVPRMPMPNMPMNRMGVQQRLPGNPMTDMQQQQMQSRPMMDNSQHPQRMMRPPHQGQHPRHNIMPPHQQMGSMPQQNMQQMNSGPGMPGQMVNRFPGMPPNPQMMSQQQQQQQGYGMGMSGNMGMAGPGNPNMSMRRPFGPGPGFQGMNPRVPNEQMLSSGPQNPHNSMGSSGPSHNEWMGNMGNMSDGSCPPYPNPQRQQPQMRPGVPTQQYHSNMSSNQGAPGQGPPQLPPSNFGQPHDHMMGQQNAAFNIGVAAQNQQLHHQQASQPQQLPNFNHHSSNSSNMKLHPQQQQPPVYGNSNSGFMKHPDNGMMCASQNSMSHHQQMQQQQQSNQMYGMGNSNMVNSGVGQMNNNMDISDQQDFNLDLLVDGMRGDDDLLNSLDSVFP